MIRYSDYLVSCGEPVIEGGGTRWCIDHGVLVPAPPFPVFISISTKEAKNLLEKSQTYFIEWSSELTEGPTEWWWSVCTSYDRSELSLNTRNKIKRGRRHCTVDRVTAYWLAQHGYDCYVKAFQRYANASPESLDSFRTGIMRTADYEDLFHYWALFSGTRVVGYAKCIIEPDKGLSTRATASKWGFFIR